MSHYSALLKQKTEATVTQPVKPPKDPTCLCDFSETDPYYFIVKEKGKIITEGSLMKIKLNLDESYLKKRIKAVHRKKDNMTAIIEY